MLTTPFFSSLTWLIFSKSLRCRIRQLIRERHLDIVALKLSGYDYLTKKTIYGTGTFILPDLDGSRVEVTSVDESSAIRQKNAIREKKFKERLDLLRISTREITRKSKEDLHSSSDKNTFTVSTSIVDGRRRQYQR